MLEPADRQLLGELLRPPPGYRLDRAISTTYSLDLTALLMMPLALTFFERRQGIHDAPDPLALLHALRQYAGRIHVYCHAGQIALPRQFHRLWAHLESSVVEVLAPSAHGVFHPKLTVLRYVDNALEEGHGEEDDLRGATSEVRYRLLCASRNLTFDRSWDTVLVLEGDLASHRIRSFARNRPLADFVGRLPSLAVRPVPPEVKKAAAHMADELGRVDFEAPAGFTDLAFWSLGLEARQSWPFHGRIDRLLIMAPFVSGGFLDYFEELQGRRVLISRSDSLDEVRPQALEPFECYFLDPAVEQAEAAGDAALPLEEEGDRPDAHAAPEGEEEPPGQGLAALTGLHAKLFVADAGHQTRLWTGSANATEAAFSANVEFLVELVGSRKLHGVEALVRPGLQAAAEDDEIDGPAVRFDQMLHQYLPPEQPVAVDQDHKQAERLADQTRRFLAQAGLAVHVGHVEGDPEDRYRLEVRGPKGGMPIPTWLPHVKVQCRPVSLLPPSAMAITAWGGEMLAAFAPVTFLAITSFIAFEVQAMVAKARCRLAFVLNLPLCGAPADRQERLLRLMLENRERLLRYLLMLLADDETDLHHAAALAALEGGHEAEASCGAVGMPLLEPLLRALDRDPRRLDQIARLVEDLERHDEGRDLLPEEFMQAWRPIWEARKGMGA